MAGNPFSVKVGNDCADGKFVYADAVRLVRMDMGPQGVAGPAGPTGPSGPQGIAGDPATDTKSVQ